MRRWTTAGLGAGLLLLVAAGAVRLAVPAVAIQLPSNLDQTIDGTGTLTVFADSTTKAALPAPQLQKAAVTARLHVVGSSGGKALLREDATIRFQHRPTTQLHQQYVVDRKSLKSVPSAQSYAYAPGDVVNRSPAYTDNMPFRSSDDTYTIWQNETGTAVEAHRTGPDVHRNGLDLVPLRSVVNEAPATDAFVTQLAPQGIPTTLSLGQLSTRLPDYGINAQQVVTGVISRLTPADQAIVLSALARPVRIDYLVSAENDLLIEPRTGALADVGKMVRTLRARPDVRPYTATVAVLNQRKYQAIPQVHAFAVKMAWLLRTPPTAPVFSLSFTQTPASAASVAGYVRGKANLITLGVRTVPMSLAVGGVLVLLVAGGFAATGARSRRPAPARPPVPERVPVGVGAAGGGPGLGGTAGGRPGAADGRRSGGPDGAAGARPGGGPDGAPGDGPAGSGPAAEDPTAGSPSRGGKHRAAQHGRPPNRDSLASRPQQALRRATQLVGRSGS